MNKKIIKIFFLFTVSFFLFELNLSKTKDYKYIGLTKTKAAVENLDELIDIRKNRQSINTFYSGESPSPTYYWQPQTLMYKDTQTNNEVWRLSNTSSDVIHKYHSDIALQPWSADGKRLGYLQEMLLARGLFTQAYTGEEGWNAWFVGNTDGSMSRPIPNSPFVCSGPAVFPWSPTNPDKFHWFGETHCGNSSAIIDTLYTGTVSDTGINRTALLNLGTGEAMKFFSNSFSSDGTKAMATQSYLADRFTYKIWPITLGPDPEIEIINGYTTGRPHDGTYWGSSPETWSTAHSGNVPLINLNSSGNYWYYWVDSYAGGTGFLTKLIGSESDGGASHTIDHTNPWTFSDFGENVPIMIGGTGNNPWIDGHYWSHPAFDRWGKYVAYSDSNDPIPYGLSVENIEAKNRLTTKQGGSTIQHNSWNGWTDYIASSRGAGLDTGCLALGYSIDAKYHNDKIFIKKYNENSLFKELVSTHTLFNNDNGCYAGAGFEYSSIPRPAQSPDGTKIAFHSTFTSQKSGTYDDNPDMFWTVAYYPYPPEIKSATKNGNNVILNWDFNQGTEASPNYSNPRTYTKRGWPNEASDRPSSPREIKGFRIWSSDNNLSWAPIGMTSYNNCNSINECGKWAETSWNFETLQPNNSTKYYAITSMEHSGLESQSLSNTWKIVTDSSGNIIEQVEQSAYPINPGSKSDFFLTKPDTALNFTATHKQAPAITDGQYTLQWQAPLNKELIRYYNIYAEDETEPIPIQQNKIASIPATSDYNDDGNFSYVDWLGNTNGTTKYTITAVDFLGNESEPLSPPTDINPPSNPTNLNIY